MHEIVTIQNALEASIAKDKLHDILSGIADYSLEQLLDLGDGIPVISYLTKGVKASLNIRDFLFMEKVVEFLRKAGEEPTEQRQRMIKNIEEDTNYSQKFGKVSLIALERFDDLVKAKYLGNAARYLARNEITFLLYKRIAFIINRLYSDDLLAFAKSHMISTPEYMKTELEALGLLKSQIITKDKSSNLISSGSSKLVSVNYKWEVTKVGRCLKSIILEQPIEFPGHPRGTPLNDFIEPRVRL